MGLCKQKVCLDPFFAFPINYFDYNLISWVYIKKKHLRDPQYLVFMGLGEKFIYIDLNG